MKKISVLLLSVLTFGISLTSCDMDTMPADSITADEYAKTPEDFAALRISLYSPLRGYFSGGNISMPDVMADNFNAVDGFTNAWGDVYRWQFTSSTGDFGGLYASSYGIIGSCNFLLDRIENLSEKDLKENFSEPGAIAELEKTKGEALYIRALMYYTMALYYCPDYEESNADEKDLGLPLQLKLNPTGDPSKYPGRSTLRETFARINADIDSAAVRITDPSYNKGYLTKDCVTALRARVALTEHKYADAVKYSEELINKGVYELTGDSASVVRMWHQGRGDKSKEFIFKLPIWNKEEMASANSLNFLPGIPGVSQLVDFVPSGDFVELFTEDDYRTSAYFTFYDITPASGISARVRLFNKYPDKTAIFNEYKPNGRFQNEPVVFRIAEFYLIAAEANARLNNLEEGTKYLNLLQAKRFKNFTPKTYANVDELFNEIKKERRREFAVEGTRLIDIKRWHDPIVRNNNVQNMDICHNPGMSNSTNLHVLADDPRMTWPIPQQEIDANPNVKQNKGY